jgi:hypothetical protein
MIHPSTALHFSFVIIFLTTILLSFAIVFLTTIFLLRNSPAMLSLVVSGREFDEGMVGG